MGLTGGGDHHRFADEAVEEGESGDGEGADHVEAEGELLPVGEAAELGELAPAGGGDHDARAHEKERFVEDVADGVGGGTVDSHLGAHAGAGDHIADLRDNVVGEQLADVVGEDGVDDAVEGHHDAEGDQDFPAGEAAEQGVDRGFGGERRHEDRAGDGGAGVGVGQPCAEGRNGGIEAESGEDQPAGGGVVEGVEMAEEDRAAIGRVKEDAGQEDGAAGQVDEDVAVTGAGGVAGASGPDQDDRGDGHQLPERVEGEEVAGECDADGAAGVEEGGGLLAGVAVVPGVDAGDDADEREDRAEEKREAVGVDDLELVGHEFEADHGREVAADGGCSRVELGGDMGEGGYRHDRHGARADRTREQSDEDGADEEDEGGGEGGETAQGAADAGEVDCLRVKRGDFVHCRGRGGEGGGRRGGEEKQERERRSGPSHRLSPSPSPYQLSLLWRKEAPSALLKTTISAQPRPP